MLCYWYHFSHSRPGQPPASHVENRRRLRGRGNFPGNSCLHRKNENAVTTQLGTRPCTPRSKSLLLRGPSTNSIHPRFTGAGHRRQPASGHLFVHHRRQSAHCRGPKHAGANEVALEKNPGTLRPTPRMKRKQILSAAALAERPDRDRLRATRCTPSPIRANGVHQARGREVWVREGRRP